MKFFYENKDMSVRVNYGTKLAFGAHLHNHIELVYMIEGSAGAFVDFKEFVINTGDAFIVFPNQIHQYMKIDKESYFISIFPPDFCPEFQNLFKHKVPVSPLIKNASENKVLISIIENIMRNKKEQSVFNDTLLKGYYLVFLSELFQMIQFEEAKSSDSDAIKSILNYCARNYTKELKLETISKDLHISKYYISHLFSQKLHMGFNDYIGMLRVTDACKLLLKNDISITEAAYNVGFNSTRSFNRLFLKHTGMTPRQYRSNGTFLNN